MEIIFIVMWIISGIFSRLLSKGFYYHRYHMLGWSKKEEAFHWFMAISGPFNLAIVSLFYGWQKPTPQTKRWTLKW